MSRTYRTARLASTEILTRRTGCVAHGVRLRILLWGLPEKCQCVKRLSRWAMWCVRRARTLPGLARGVQLLDMDVPRVCHVRCDGGESSKAR